MSYTYVLTRMTHGNLTHVEIDQGEFEKIRLARANLYSTLFIEEKLDMLLQNYVEFEQLLLELTLRQVVYSISGWSNSVSEIHRINRRCLNLLATCAMYLDHTPKILRSSYGKDNTSEKEFNRIRTDRYSQSLAYRFCYELRNHSQHRGFSINGTYSSGDWNNECTKNVHTIAICTTTDELRTMGFAEKIAKEVEGAIGKRFDIKPLVREFVCELGHVHTAVRSAMKKDLQEWTTTVDDAIAKYEQQSESIVSLVAAVLDGSKVIDSHHLSRDCANRIQELQYQNRNITHFAKHFVSGDVMDNEKYQK